MPTAPSAPPPTTITYSYRGFQVALVLHNEYWFEPHAFRQVALRREHEAVHTLQQLSAQANSARFASGVAEDIFLLKSTAN